MIAKKKILKHFFPLIIAFIAAFIFFLGYNHYLLDASVANLKISLRDLKKSKDLDDIKKITVLLNDSFLSEVVKGDFDLALAIKMEMTSQLTDQSLTKTEADTRNYVFRLSSATNIDFSSMVAEKISKESQAADIRHFITKAIDERVKKQPLIVSKIEDILITIFPGRRKENISLIERKIKQISKSLEKYKGEELQERYLAIGKLYLLMKNWQEAQNYFTKSLQIDSQNETGIKTQFFLAVLYKAKEDFQQAGMLFGKIKDQLPQEWKYFAAYQEADCAYRAGDIEKATALFEEIFNKNPSLEIPQLAQFRAAYAYLYDLKNPVKAHEAFMKLEKDEPSSDLSSYVMHKINPDMAWQYCLEGFKLLEEGYSKSSPEKYKLSLDKFDSALKIVPDHSTTYIGKALAFYFLDEPEASVKEGIKAKEMDSKNDAVLANLGFLYANMNMLDKATEQYREAIKINPSSSIYNYNLATIYAFRDDYAKAETYFREAIKLDNRYAYAYNNLGYIFWREGLHREAKENLKKAIALKPEYVDPHYNLGVIYYTLGNYEDSRKEFTIVEQLMPKFRQTRWYLNRISKKLGYK
jgi:tetratricopeptide (TPR) repeat protein